MRSFPALLSRLSRLHAVLQRDHPLEMRPDTHNLTLLEFHGHMINHCIQNKLPQLLYFYLDYWR